MTTTTRLMFLALHVSQTSRYNSSLSPIPTKKGRREEKASRAPADNESASPFLMTAVTRVDDWNDCRLLLARIAKRGERENERKRAERYEGDEGGGEESDEVASRFSLLSSSTSSPKGGREQEIPRKRREGKWKEREREKEKEGRNRRLWATSSRTDVAASMDEQTLIRRRVTTRGPLLTEKEKEYERKQAS